MTARFSLLAVSLLRLIVVGAPSPTGFTKPEARLTAIVANQRCLTSDDVYVTYTASLDPPGEGTLYRWDFNNDGLFDTDPNPDPTAHTGYPKGVVITARVQASNGRETVQATVRFRTMDCD
ncbi:MAG TPA: PKD domain-containing protein [Chthoniobacterales bacterium]|jgi:hypothetical protein